MVGHSADGRCEGLKEFEQIDRLDSNLERRLQNRGRAANLNISTLPIKFDRVKELERIGGRELTRLT